MIRPFQLIALPVITLLAAMITLGGCAGDSGSGPRWAEAPDAGMAARDTFAWEGASGTPVTILDEHIRDSIRARLLAKGYVESSGEADFLVSHETIESEALDEGHPVRIGIGVGSWGGRVGGSVGTSVDVGEKAKMVNRLNITIRALDPRARRELWMGTTTALPEVPEPAAIERAVDGVMKHFPGRGA